MKITSNDAVAITTVGLIAASIIILVETETLKSRIGKTEDRWIIADAERRELEEKVTYLKCVVAIKSEDDNCASEMNRVVITHLTSRQYRIAYRNTWGEEP
jgi:hypothetical protein